MTNKVKTMLGEDLRMFRFLEFVAITLGYHAPRRRKFAFKHNGNYFFFAESPLDHCYPRAGISFSIAKKSN